MAFTFFFRDSQTLELALDAVVPQLSGRAFIHVWDAGCAHGPEPYTLAILLRQRLSPMIFRNVRIHATDIERDFNSQVVSGVFPESQVQRIPDEFRRTYFQPAGESGGVQVVEELRGRVSFEVHNLLSLRPIRRDLSLIICKNVLLHFEESQRQQVIQMFYDALLPGGVLAMEHTQRMPEELAPLFEKPAPHAQVYQKPFSAVRHPTHRQGAPHRPQPVRQGSFAAIQSCEIATPEEQQPIANPRPGVVSRWHQRLWRALVQKVN